MGEFIPLSVPNFNEKELEYVKEAVETEWVSTAGAFISKFEDEITSYVGSKGAVACQSGTAGLHLALKVLGVTSDDEVIVPTLTFVAAVNPVKYLNAEPIFMDCDDYLTIDVEKLKKFCEEECVFENNHLINKKTKKVIKAIVVVHVFGNMADMEPIVEISKKYNIKLVEDATEALGTYYIEGKYKGRFAGTIGDIGVYSFNGNKIITTGGGGMIVSNHEEYLRKCKYLSTQAKDDTLYFNHEEIGYNYRMTNLQAALGLAQLEKLEEFIKVKKKNYNLYMENNIKLLPFRKNIRPNYWFYSYYTEYRDLLLNALSEKKIQTRPIWKLIHTLTPYKNAQIYHISKAYLFYDKILNIPCSSNLESDGVLRVISAIKEAEGSF